LGLSKNSNDIWDELNLPLESKAQNAKSNLKQQLFRFKMASKHVKVNTTQLVEIETKVEEEDTNVMLLNSLPQSYSNLVFTLVQLPIQSLKSAIFATEEHRCV
jgi:hypothetical protein